MAQTNFMKNIHRPNLIFDEMTMYHIINFAGISVVLNVENFCDHAFLALQGSTMISNECQIGSFSSEATICNMRGVP